MESDYLHYAIYFAAYFFSVTAFFFNSVSILRFFTIVSSTCYAIYYFSFPAEPLWLDIGSEGLLVIVNIVMLFIIYYREKTSVLNTEEKEIFESIFTDFSAFEFYKLAKAGKWQNIKQGELIIEKDKAVTDIHFIYSGLTSVELSGNRVVELSDGHFLGERSYSISEKANANVVTKEETRLLSWNQEDLNNLFKRNPSMKRSFERVITSDLAKKLDL